MTSLKAGLIAGAVGLALVLLYSLLYYRVLGLLTALSLILAGAMVYALLVLLGRYINYTLDLAGIAGLIIGIGTTADSFVVFFERIKDEIREGRSFRSAVPRGWARARKTILSGNAVTFLAAAVLYFLAVGQVKRLRLHAGSDDDPGRAGGVPGDLAAGVPVLQVGHAGQAGVQRARRGPADRPRTACACTARRDGDSQMSAKHSSEEITVVRRPTSRPCPSDQAQLLRPPLHRYRCLRGHRQAQALVRRQRG